VHANDNGAARPIHRRDWKALRQIYPTTREQRCWVHKTANVLDKLPKAQQPKAKAMLHDIWQADTKLMESAAKKWRLLNGSPLLTKVIAGVRFVDGVEQTNAA
jgi:transposase-like protein